MTEASENAYLVRVRAQVMCRDEGTGGWVALGGGGLADVMVGRRPRHCHHAAGGDSNGDTTSSSASAPPHEYYIHGKRISDNMVVLECTIKKDFQYNKVMPTFHHWVTDEKRFGLTFQTAADARAFDRGVRTAIEELLDEVPSETRTLKGIRYPYGLAGGSSRAIILKSKNNSNQGYITALLKGNICLGGAWPSLHAYKKYNPAPKEDDEEQNIFECLNLPSDSRSSSENSTASRPRPERDARDPTPILSAITLPSLAHAHPGPESLKQYEMYEEKMGIEESDPCPYVHLSPVHEYTYPQVGPGGVIMSEKSSPNTKPPLMKRDSGSIKKSGYGGPPPLPDKKPTESIQARLKCRHCHEWYLESANRAGACEFAPDCFRSCIDCVTCIKCAQCMLYHCMSDAEGDFAMHPCACAAPDDACAKRWVGITLLSLVVPCLWCYLPLRAVHRAACAARLAGGHHQRQHAPARP